MIAVVVAAVLIVLTVIANLIEMLALLFRRKPKPKTRKR
jgi:hypothetical protein